jgi:IS30 family transposase
MEFTNLAREKGVAVGRVYSHLSVEDRNAIERMGAEGLSSRAIAAAIGRAPSTITREIRRGVWSAADMNASYKPYRDPRLRSPSTIPDPVYVGVWAHHKALHRRQRSHQPWRMRHDPLVGYVTDKLRAGWSPQLISGRLKRDFPDQPKMRACPETIYAWIYHPSRRERRWMD